MSAKDDPNYDPLSFGDVDNLDTSCIYSPPPTHEANGSQHGAQQQQQHQQQLTRAHLAANTAELENSTTSFYTANSSSRLPFPAANESFSASGPLSDIPISPPKASPTPLIPYPEPPSIPKNTSIDNEPGLSLNSHGGYSGNTMNGGRPSYAPLPPIDHEPAGHARSFHSHNAADQRMALTVGQPVKVIGPSGIPGVNDQYLSYPITTLCTSLRSSATSEFVVRRRFKDVVAMSDMLQLLHPGYFIPPRPHRNAIEGRRMQTRFVEDRRAGLERYLNRLAAHPVISSSEALRAFLQVEGDLRTSAAWRQLQPPSKGYIHSTARFLNQMVGRERTVPTPVDVTQPARVTTDMYRVVHERLASMQGALKAAPVTPLEGTLREEGARVEETKHLLALLSQRADTWVRRQNERQAVYADLSRAFQGLSSYEEAVGANYGLAKDESAVADGCLKISKLLSLTADHAAKHLAYINDYLDYIPSIQAAMEHRESARLTAATLEVDLAKRRGRLDAAIAAGPAQASKRPGLEQEVAQLQTALSAAHDVYRQVSEHNAAELVSWRGAMQADMLAMVKEFTLVQVASAHKAEGFWTEAYSSIQQ